MADNTSSWLDFAQRSRDDGGLGLEKHQASGLVGNLQNESGSGLSSWGPTGDNGSAWGTAQWRNERLDGLKAHAAENGLDYRTPEAQQAWMRKEFDTTHSKAYDALRASATPEDAATAVNRMYEISADRSGNRERSARSLFDGSPAVTAIQSAMRGQPRSTAMGFAPDETTPGALSPEQGVLSNGGKNSFLAKLGDALVGMAPGIAQDPEHAKALQAVAAASQKTAAAQGTWSMGAVDPKSGRGVMTNSLTGQQIIKQIHAPQPDKAEKDFASQGYETATGKAFAEQNQKIAADAVSSQGALGNLDTLRAALTNPNVYQGTGGENIAYLKKLGNSIGLTDYKGIADADVSAALINKLTQESRQLNGGMPGSLSDKDLSFLKAANAGLDKTPEANQRIIDIYEKLHKRNIEMNADRVAYINGGKQQLDEGFNAQQAAKLTARHAAENAAFKAEQAAAAPAPKATTPMKRTPNGVSWSIN